AGRASAKLGRRRAFTPRCVASRGRGDRDTASRAQSLSRSRGEERAMAVVDRSQQQKKGEIRSEIEKMFGKVPGWVEAMPDSALEGFWSMMRDFQLAETAI